METDLRRFGMYTMTPLKEIFNAINGIIGYGGLQACQLNFHDDYSMAEAIKGTEGRADTDAIKKHIGHIVSCDYIMKDRLVDAFVKDNVSMVMTSVLEEKDNGLVKEKIHCWVDKRDDERAMEIVKALNQELRSKEGQLKDFLVAMQEQQTPIVQISIEKSLLQAMEQEGMLRGIHYGTKPLTREVMQLVVRERDAQYVRSAAKEMLFMCGRSMEAAALSNMQEWYDRMGKSMAAILDAHKPCEIIDGNSPAHRIVTDSKGIHVMVKDRDMDFIKWTDPRVQERVYDYLALYGNQERIDQERNPVGQRKDFLDRHRQPEELETFEKLERYKRMLRPRLKEILLFTEQTERQEELGRGHDRRILFNAAIDHAITLGQSDLAEDLKSDKAMNGRALEGGLSLGSVDTSDIYERGFSEKEQCLSDFCWECMGGRYIMAEVEEDYLPFLDELMREPAVRDLMGEEKEIRQWILCEVKETMEFIQTMEIPVMEMELETLQKGMDGQEKICITDREELEY